MTLFLVFQIREKEHIYKRIKETSTKVVHKDVNPKLSTYLTGFQ